MKLKDEWISDIQKKALILESHHSTHIEGTAILYKTGYDFKRLFPISEYYDQDRPLYYQAIQSVRKNNMDMTGWLVYFVEGLRLQMGEIRKKGEQLIKQDVKLQKIN